MNDRNIRRYVSPVNTVILVLNVLVFIVLELLGDTRDSAFMAYHGAVYGGFVIEMHQYWRLVTAVFMHFGIRHLFNNMVVLAFIGDNLERAVGKVRYIIIYLVSGVLANLVSCVISYMRGDNVVAAGASGAIFGVVGALLWILVANHGFYEDLSLRRVILFAIFSIYLGLQSSTVDNMAHIAGLIIGFILSWVLYRGGNNKKNISGKYL